MVCKNSNNSRKSVQNLIVRDYEEYVSSFGTHGRVVNGIYENLFKGGRLCGCPSWWKTFFLIGVRIFAATNPVILRFYSWKGKWTVGG